SPRNVSVEINGDKIHPMLVFANPLEINPPTASGQGVIYYGPGLYDINSQTLQSNTTYYLAGGAYLRWKGPTNNNEVGAFYGSNLQNVVIRGRGILSAELVGYKPIPGGQTGLLFVSNPNGTNDKMVIDGITFVDSAQYNLQLFVRNAA